MDTTKYGYHKDRYHGYVVVHPVQPKNQSILCFSPTSVGKKADKRHANSWSSALSIKVGPMEGFSSFFMLSVGWFYHQGD